MIFFLIFFVFLQDVHLAICLKAVFYGIQSMTKFHFTETDFCVSQKPSGLLPLFADTGVQIPFFADTVVQIPFFADIGVQIPFFADTGVQIPFFALVFKYRSSQILLFKYRYLQIMHCKN